MAQFFGKLLIALGSLLLLHAGYYSVKLLTYLLLLFVDAEYVKLTEVTDAKMPPFEVVVELLLSFVLSLIGVLITSGEVLPIRSSGALHARSLPDVISSPEFHVFNHRAKALHKRIAS
ncbi:Membrane protein, partial [Globisporangium splendens]